MTTDQEKALEIISSNARGEHWLPDIDLTKVKMSTAYLLFVALDDIERKTSKAKNEITKVLHTKIDEIEDARMLTVEVPESWLKGEPPKGE